MFETLALVLDWFGVAVFAITGALVASRKQMDVTGFIMLGTVTGIGGGTVRDTLLGQFPVFWIGAPSYLLVCVGASVATFFLAHIPQSRYALLLRLDAIGMALFAVTGAEKALAAGAAPVVAMTMGVITATFGGMTRDILGGESPVILRSEIYATAALIGAATFVLATSAGLPREIGFAAGFLLGAAVRFGALRWNWSLPRYRPRPERTSSRPDAR